MRRIINLNQGWKFSREDVGLPDAFPEDWKNNWRDVNLPHTWNAVDGMDGSGNYYRGRCWYAKRFAVPEQPLPGGRLYVEVLAAGQQAMVYVNGKEAVYHEGGYSIFRADITELCLEEVKICWWWPVTTPTRRTSTLSPLTSRSMAGCTGV